MLDYFLLFGLLGLLGLAMISPALFLYVLWRGLRMIFRKRVGITYASL